MTKSKKIFLAFVPLLPVIFCLSFEFVRNVLATAINENPAGLALWSAPLAWTWYRWCRDPNWLWCLLMLVGAFLLSHFLGDVAVSMYL